jgi:probable rRNA maturation factor
MHSSSEADTAAPSPSPRITRHSIPRARGGGLSSAARLIRRQRKVRADWREIEEFLERAMFALAPLPFSVGLLSDAAIRRYNARFRRIDEATDVLSFPAGKGALGDHGYLGDILISAETARRNASVHGVRLEDEIKALILHGLLHLLGQDHERDRGRMARSERFWGARLGLPQTLLARSRKASRKSSAKKKARRLPVAGGR